MNKKIAAKGWFARPIWLRGFAARFRGSSVFAPAMKNAQNL
jgi:hypothetical protein